MEDDRIEDIRAASEAEFGGPLEIEWNGVV